MGHLNVSFWQLRITDWRKIITSKPLRKTPLFPTGHLSTHFFVLVKCYSLSLWWDKGSAANRVSITFPYSPTSQCLLGWAAGLQPQLSQVFWLQNLLSKDFLSTLVQWSLLFSSFSGIFLRIHSQKHIWLSTVFCAGLFALVGTSWNPLLSAQPLLFIYAASPPVTLCHYLQHMPNAIISLLYSMDFIYMCRTHTDKN